jgi:mono/diheme cytochrome c family protein
MIRAVLSIFVVLIAALSIRATARAQQNIDVGKLEYEKGCIGCHGVGAQGSGVHTPRLTKDPPDLTVLAKANGGLFPMVKIYEVIDGREQVQQHGTREMPIWGKEYSTSELILLIDYLYRIQQK